MKKKKKHYNESFTTRKSFLFIITMSLLIVAFSFYSLVFLYFVKYLELMISLLFLFVITMVAFNNKIVLERYYIRVYFGIFVYKIKYNEIKDIYISDNHFSSFSSSYHKVGIKTSSHRCKIFDTFVCPMDREDFIYEVNKRRFDY